MENGRLEVDAQGEAGVRVVPEPAEAATEVVIKEAPPPPKLTLEEMQSIEILGLKVNHMQTMVQNLDLQKQQLINQMREGQKEMEVTVSRLSAKYGVDIRRSQVLPDGTIVRKG